MKGDYAMIHLYCGDGKGKTTAAMGLALRMAGRDRPVVIAQFLKGSDSGERLALAQLPQVRLLELPEKIKFSSRLSPDERTLEQQRYQAMLGEIRALAADPGLGLLVLDEACAAVTSGLVSVEDILSCLDAAAGCEVVITGRDPAQEFQDRADYITEFHKVRHPFDRGISARLGVEF